jgi:hypothetical protein
MQTRVRTPMPPSIGGLTYQRLCGYFSASLRRLCSAFAWRDNCVSTFVVLRLDYAAKWASRASPWSPRGVAARSTARGDADARGARTGEAHRQHRGIQQRFGYRGCVRPGMLMLWPQQSELWGQALISLRASRAGMPVKAVQTAHGARRRQGLIARGLAHRPHRMRLQEGDRPVRLTRSKTCVGSRAAGACGGADRGAHGPKRASCSPVVSHRHQWQSRPLA